MLDVRTAMRRAAQHNADSLAIISEDRTLTFSEAWSRGVKMANALLSLGLKAGDRVAVLEDNSLEASDFFVGAAAANLVRVPLYKRNSSESHAHMMRHTGCRAVVVSAEYQSEIEELKSSVSSLEHVVTRGADYESWLASFSDVDPNPDIDPDDIYIIRHSGGTTGTPKGMAFSHEQWMTTIRDWTYMLPKIEAGDFITHVAPISHGSGYFFTPGWLAGACNILMPKFNALKLFDILERHGGYFFAVPTILSDLVSARDGRKFPKVKGIIVAGAPIRPQTALAARELFGNVLHQFYGQTEATPVAWMGPDDWFSDVKGSEPLLASGRVMPFAAVEVRDDQNKPLGVDQVGELALKTGGQIKEIWGEPELTSERLVDGWVLSGDIGRIDKNGYLYLVDRKDDMIISGGLNIWPAELELVISSLPGVREVAVVAAPDPRWGETPVAVVVLEAGASLSAEDVISACSERLGSYKKPSTVVLQRDPLPRTPVGKIQRKAVRQAFWTDQASKIGGS